MRQALEARPPVRRRPPGTDDGAAGIDDSRADGATARQPGAENGRRGPDHHRGAAGPGPARRRPGPGKDSKVKFELTDKSLDFLGFKTLKDLLGSLGKSSFGRHDTRDLATGIETSGSLQALRIRRHAEPGCQRDAVFRHPPRRRARAAQHGIRRPAACTSASTRAPARRC